ncbi:MAG TPA: 4Fe-4S dicluster domain-containing protein [Candidatus Moranbacteria bacterium]|nr:4Fe-4S dicluster domain-containing protein [Candidatus Moranbacteria bacterium]
MEKGGIISHDETKAPRTGDWRYMHPQIDPAKCVGCKTCVPHCPEAVMEMRLRTAEEMALTPENFKKKEIVDVDMDYCKGCGVCAQVCPVKAISMRK